MRSSTTLPTSLHTSSDMLEIVPMLFEIFALGSDGCFLIKDGAHGLLDIFLGQVLVQASAKAGVAVQHPVHFAELVSKP